MPGLVMDVGDRDRDRVFVDRIRDLVLFAEPHLHAPAGRGGNALRDIIVGGEVAALEDQDAAIGAQRDRRRQNLEQILARRIADDDLAFLRTDQRRKLVAEVHRQVEPARAVPALDKVGTPFAGHHVVRARRRTLRHRAERIAVEIDHSRRNIEAIAQGGERIGGIHGRTGGAIETIKRHGSKSPSSATFRAPQSALPRAPYSRVRHRRTAWHRGGSRSNR